MNNRPSLCPKCKLPVSWWHNASREDRKIMVDLSPDPESGTVQKIASKDPVTKADKIFGKVLSGKALADAVSEGEMLFTLHKSSCLALKPLNPRPAGVEFVSKKKTQRR